MAAETERGKPARLAIAACTTAAPVATAYYANSYVCHPDDASCVHAWSAHDATRFPALVRAQRTVGVQFHPEKSSMPGVELVCAFLREAAR